MNKKDTFISQEEIQNVLDSLGQSPDFIDELIEEIQSEQPAIINWIFSDSFDILNQEEKDYFLFLSIVIIRIMTKKQIPQAQIAPQKIELQEEKNWSVFMEQKAKSFRDKINIFFEAYPQEDLLAFIEDALEQDLDDQVVTTIGRPPIFVALKTILDVMLPVDSGVPDISNAGDA